MGFEQIKVSLESHWSSDRAAAEAAWASSTNKEKLQTRSDEDIKRVVTGLVNLHHDTPKERCWLEFFITCPIFVERQFDKYRMTVQYQDFQLEYLEAPMGRNNITQNELSGRYRTIPDRPYYLPEDVDDILQTAISKDWEEKLPFALISNANWAAVINSQHDFYQQQLSSLKEAEKLKYITNLEYKRAREVLRGILGTAYLTDMRIVMNMNAFEHIINQRLAKDAQMESRVVAYLMIKELLNKKVVPILLKEMIIVNKWNDLMKDIDFEIGLDY